MPTTRLPPLSTVLTSARLVLRPPHDDDVGEIRRSFRADHAHLAPWLPRPVPGVDPSSVTEIANLVVRQRRLWRTGLGFCFHVALRERPGRFVGRVNLNNVVWASFQNATLGYWVTEEVEGKGVAREAVRTVVDFAFEALGLHRVDAGIMPSNLRSRRLVEALGFREEGRAAKYVQIAGSWEDHLLYAITSDDWAPPDTAPPA